MGQVNFLGIGAQKAGTTWLHAALNLHPDVSLHPLKELHFFDAKYVDKDGGVSRKQKGFRRLKRKFVKSSESNQEVAILPENDPDKINIKALKRLAFKGLSYKNYFSLFEGLEGKIIGEITPRYSCIPEEGVREMRENLGDIKIVYMIRNPVKRAWSMFRMMYQKDLQEIINQKRPNEGIFKLFKTHKRIFLKGSDARTDYRSAVQTYSSYFSKIHYIFYDDLCKNPSQVLQELCDFLEISYDQEIFLPVLNERQREGIKVEIPNRLKALLSKRYQEQEDFIQETFGKTLIY